MSHTYRVFEHKGCGTRPPAAALPRHLVHWLKVANHTAKLACRGSQSVRRCARQHQRCGAQATKALLLGAMPATLHGAGAKLARDV